MWLKLENTVAVREVQQLGRANAGLSRSNVCTKFSANSSPQCAHVAASDIITQLTSAHGNRLLAKIGEGSEFDNRKNKRELTFAIDLQLFVLGSVARAVKMRMSFAFN